MKFLRGGLILLMLIQSNTILSERGTRARTMHNHTQRSAHSSGSSRPSVSSYRPYSSGSTPGSSHVPAYRHQPPARVEPAVITSIPPELAGVTETAPESASPQVAEPATRSVSDSAGTAAAKEAQLSARDLALNHISLNSRVAFTSWDFNFGPAIESRTVFLPTYELDLNLLGLEFSYLTTTPLGSSNLFREIPVIDQKNILHNSNMESLGFTAMPLMFLSDPLWKNLIAVEFRKTTKAATVKANQKIYYFPAASSPGLTGQDSDLGMIFYDEKAAGTQLAYTIRERDWLFTLGFYALRVGFFDLSYSKPYQMDADIYQGEQLVDRRIFLFEGQATGQGFMIGVQNLYFPNWQVGRFQFAAPDGLAPGFFWGLKELGLYWGSGNIRLQNNIDLVEKYREFYQGENGREPTVTFLRQVFHIMVGYKFNRHIRAFVEYRYVNYSLALEDNYDDGAYNYFLNHAINRDTVQQVALNVTVGF